MVKNNDGILISGFCMVRNATKLYYPVKASIQSVLPIVDEFVVALGNCDEDDDTLNEILSIGSNKIRIVHTVWELDKYPGGSEYARQTDIAKSNCKGEWLLYIQSDEVIHEKYLSAIRSRCQDLVNDKEVEGLLFEYIHFWGDYHHYIRSHAWYPHEIRIIRNDPDIHSWRDAQSFRRIPDFDGKSYFRKENTFKLKVVEVKAVVYHYGWVRPPRLMQKKKISFENDLQGSDKMAASVNNEEAFFNYGDLSRLAKFKDSHPGVMADFIKQFNWQNQLNLSVKITHKHDKLKYRILSWIEQHLLGGRQIAGFKNYVLLKRVNKS